MFQRSRSKVKSISVAIAQKLGFLDTAKAKEADDEIQKDTDESPTLVLLVKKGFLCETQAAQVEAQRKKESPLDEMGENVKMARFAVRNAFARR